MNIYQWSELSTNERAVALQRPAVAQSAELALRVREIIADVRARGDEALVDLTKKFDAVELSQFAVTRDEQLAAEVELAESDPTDRLNAALRVAYGNIEKFHVAQLPRNLQLEVLPGVQLEKKFVPIETVGLYVPGGTAVLPSTLLMLAIPAAIAGCRRRILCTPPDKNGRVHPAILAAARLCGIEQIFKIGGAQAIAAMAFGTASVPKVDKIFGPGNAYVTQAKIQVAQDPGGAACDMPAGPSEVLIISDGIAPASFTAADLLSQAEHGRDSQVVLVATRADIVRDVKREIETQLAALPRAEIARAALAHSVAIVASGLAECFEIANQYAPEHLILQIDSPELHVARVRNAGSVFLGAWSPEAVGDYASGTNHVLPTYGFARAYSGLGTEAFMKSITFQKISAAGLRAIGPAVEVLAQAEGLFAHSQAVTLRLQRLGEESNHE